MYNYFYLRTFPVFSTRRVKRRGGLRQSRKTGQFVIPRSRGIQSAKPTCVIFAFITQVDAKRQLDPGLRRDDGAADGIPLPGEGPRSVGTGFRVGITASHPKHRRPKRRERTDVGRAVERTGGRTNGGRTARVVEDPHAIYIA